MARELERRWNEKLRAVAELEAEYRQEQERGLSSREQIDDAARRGDLLAYRARVGRHWEWRLSPAQAEAACVG